MNPDEIRQLISRAGSKAANFKRVDLQVHSDESGDFPRTQEYGGVRFEPGTENAKPVASETILKAAVNKGLDVIAITDHMKSRKSCEVALASGKSGNNMVALPAIEVALRLTQVSRSSTDSVHLLCIFKEGKSSEDIERIFHGARGLKSYERRADGDVIDMDLKAFVENVHKNEGICIASHVNAEKGLRRAFFSLSEMDYVVCKRDREALGKQKEQPHWNDAMVGELGRLQDIEKRLANEIQNSYLEFLVDAGIDAIQIQKSAERQFYRGVHCETLRIRPLAAVLTSDAHCLEAIGFETKITYLKMTRSCWDDLRLALKDPETRVRYADTVGTHRYTKIKGIVFVTTDGFFKGLEKDGKTFPQVLGFADNLTCLIGGRGAGKSAAIDALRYVFKEKEEVDSLPPNLRSDIYGRLGHTLKDTSIYLLLESEEGEEILVKSFYAGWDRRTYESRFISGEEAGVDLSVSSKYRAEIYGWNEIETLGTDSRKQLQLLDRFIEDLKQINDSIKSKKAQLEVNRAKIVECAKRLEGLVPTVKDFEESKSAYEKINTPEMQKVFAEVDAVLAKEKLLEGLSEDLKVVLQEVSVVYDLRSKLNELASRVADGSLRSRVFGEGNSQLEQAAAAHSELLEILGAVVRSLDREIIEVKVEKSGALEKLSSVAGGDVKGLANVEKRLARKTRYEQLLAQKGKITKERHQLEAALDERKKLVSEYEQLQLQRTQKRAVTKDDINAKLDRAIKHGPRIAINFSPLGDTEEFQRRLGVVSLGSSPQRETGLLKGISLKYMERRFAEIISSQMKPTEFARKILDGAAESFEGAHADGKSSISAEDSKRILDHLNPRVTEFGEEYFDVDKLGRLLELEEVELNDLPEITLEGQPIAVLSPGQRCSALVPIILLQGNHPLIIDQPEDNLDNKLVFDLVVEILRSLKEFRQIIVATHNPNIPVSGDAEQILVFESIDKFTGRVATQGSIDGPEVIEAVKDIMEGGAEAFLTRAEKYRYHITP